jgi:tetratricopeptide (TPR) repeat protein
MRTSQRHHLKENDFARLVGRLNLWLVRNSRALTIGVAAAAVVALAVIGYTAWQSSVERSARGLLVEAMVVLEAPVTPAASPLEGIDAAPPMQQPGTYPTEEAKLEAALPRLVRAADEYPRTDAGQTARYHAAATLVALGRFDEAIAQYDRVSADASGLLAHMARLGKAEAQLRAGQYDAAIASFRDLADRSDTNVPKEALLLELARAYRLAGNNEEARKTLTQIVEQHAGSPFATEAREELERIQS